MNKPQAAYFAVIPASVRYDKKVPHGAKLLYGEISALCNKEGYCWAGNDYFVKLYQVNEKTIRNWIGKLRDSGHIKVSFTYVKGKKEIECRYIYLCEAISINKSNKKTKQITPDESETRKIFSKTVENNFHTNSKDHPNIEKHSTNKKNKLQKTVQITTKKPDLSTVSDLCMENNFHTPGKNLPEVGKISSPRMENNCHTSGKNLPEVGKISSKGMEKNCRDNNTCNNTCTTTTTPHQHEQDMNSLPTVEKVVAAHISANELKDTLAVLDNRLYFRQNFYQEAADFMFKYKLDLKYTSWLHDYCVSQNPKTFKNYYFSVFFEDNLAEEYKASLQPVSKPKPPPQPVICPVCGVAHGRDDESCPACGLPKNPSQDDILLYSELFLFSPEKRNEYLSREEIICGDLSGDIFKKKEMLAVLKLEYGLTVYE